MPALSREDFMGAIKARIGEDTSDEALKFVTDMSDTYDTLEKGAKGDGIDWKAKYEENDKSWREKYRDTFFSSPAKQDDPISVEPVSEPEPKKVLKYEDLFTTEKGK